MKSFVIKIFWIAILSSFAYFIFSENPEDLGVSNDENSNYSFEIYGNDQLLWKDELYSTDHSKRTDLLNKLDCSQIKCDYPKDTPYSLIFSKGNESNQCVGFYMAEQFEKLVPWRKNDSSLLLPSISNSGFCVEYTDGKKLSLGQIKGSYFGISYSIIIKEIPRKLAK